MRHRRRTPVSHCFSYRVAQLYLDLSEINQIFRDRWFWSIDAHNLAEFRRGDYLGPREVPLDRAVRACVARARGRAPEGPIRLLTHLRYANYVFNPVSFYYCFFRDGAGLDAIVAEITNTPWGERHSYVLDVGTGKRVGSTWRWSFEKAFHVSPFLPLHCRYDWKFSEPAERLFVHMDVLNDVPQARESRREFDATLLLERRALDARALRRVLWRYPLMTARIIGAIHWQAIRLWLKGAPRYGHPAITKDFR